MRQDQKPRSGFIPAAAPLVYWSNHEVRSRQDAIRKISWVGIYRAGRLVNVRSGGNLASDSVVSGESAQARRGPPRDDSSALHRWWAIPDFWRRIISNQSEQAPGVSRFLTPSPVNTARRIVVASFSFCVSSVSDEEALNLDRPTGKVETLGTAGRFQRQVKQEPGALSKWQS